jgi:putative FmdB family regulatory protein
VPLYSYRCEACGTTEDRISTIATRNEQDCACGTRLSRTYTLGAVVGDDIPGGFVQENFGHQPETFYSKKAMARRAKELGLEPFVRHVDGDKHVTRWI